MRISISRDHSLRVFAHMPWQKSHLTFTEYYGVGWQMTARGITFECQIPTRVLDWRVDVFPFRATRSTREIRQEDPRLPAMQPLGGKGVGSIRRSGGGLDADRFPGFSRVAWHL